MLVVKGVLFVAPPISVTTTSADEEDETDDMYGVAVRRCAVKQPKIFVVRGHKFIETFFKSPTFCSYCSEFLWLVLMLALMIEKVFMLFAAIAYKYIVWVSQMSSAAASKQELACVESAINTNQPTALFVFLNKTYASNIE